MCIDKIFGSSGGSESGPKWSSGDSDLINNILMGGILSKLPKGALQPMLNSQDSGLGNFLNRVYGGGGGGQPQGPSRTGNAYGGNGGLSFGGAGGSPFSGPVQPSAPQPAVGGGGGAGGGSALDNLQAFNTGNYNDMRPGAMGYNILGGGGAYTPGWQSNQQAKPFSGYNRINSQYKIF